MKYQYWIITYFNLDIFVIKKSYWRNICLYWIFWQRFLANIVKYWNDLKLLVMTFNSIVISQDKLLRVAHVILSAPNAKNV